MNTTLSIPSYQAMVNTFNIKFKHFFDVRDNKGGLCIAMTEFLPETGYRVVGLSLCSRKDHYTKEVGRRIAVTNLVRKPFKLYCREQAGVAEAMNQFFDENGRPAPWVYDYANALGDHRHVKKFYQSIMDKTATTKG